MITRLQSVYEALETKRNQLKLTESTLCEGICSVRTYRRYIYQDSEMPFHMLEQLLDRLHTNIYDFFYFIEHGIKMDHFDEVLLLDRLIQDDYEGAKPLYQTFLKQKKEIVVSPFLLPLMLEKLEAYEASRSLDAIHKKMIGALKLHILVKRPFLTVDQLKLMEHVIPFARQEERDIMDLVLKRVVEGEMTLIRASLYSRVKCHALRFQLALYHQDTKVHVSMFTSVLLAIYEIGGELAIDEILSTAMDSKVHHTSNILKTLLETYYIASSFMYHENQPFEETLEDSFVSDLKRLLQPQSFYDDISHALY